MLKISRFFQMPIETLGEFMSLFEKASQQRFVCLIAAHVSLGNEIECLK